MAPEATDPTPPEKKPRTIDQFSPAELVELAKNAASHPDATQDQAAKVVGNVSTEFLRRSQILAEQREIKTTVEAKHNRGKRLTQQEIDDWKKASETLNDYADFDEHAAKLTLIKDSLQV